jgi:hypothetical protein
MISDVLAAYWKDYPERRDKSHPAFLGRDILGMWKRPLAGTHHEMFIEFDNLFSPVNPAGSDPKSRLLTQSGDVLGRRIPEEAAVFLC